MNFERNNYVFLYLVHGDTYCVFADDLHDYFIKMFFKNTTLKQIIVLFLSSLNWRWWLGGILEIFILSIN